MVTEAIIAVYPDVFKGGAEFAGVPAGCWAVDDPDGQWSSTCAGGMVTHTAQEWGDIARAMDPGYTGFRPRLQMWHGSADSIILYTNHTEAIKQWTDVMGFVDAMGMPDKPAMTTTVSIGGHAYTHDEWKDACMTVLDVWSEDGGPHSTDANMNGQYTIPFLGLDKPGDVDPQVAGCMASGGMPASGGSAGMVGTAGLAGDGRHELHEPRRQRPHRPGDGLRLSCEQYVGLRRRARARACRSHRRHVRAAAAQALRTS